MKAYLRDLAEIERLCFPSDPWSLQTLTDCMNNEWYLWSLAKSHEEQVIAYGCALLSGGTGGDGEILRVAVLPEFRRRRYGGRIVSELLFGLSLYDAKRAFLEVRESNIPARALYAATGFSYLATRPHYYPDGENAIILEKNLSAI